MDLPRHSPTDETISSRCGGSYGGCSLESAADQALISACLTTSAAVVGPSASARANAEPPARQASRSAALSTRRLGDTGHHASGL